MSAPDVKFFGLSTCIHCKNAKAYLDECHVDYNCVFVDKLSGDEKKAVMEEVRQYNPSLSFPTMVINGVVVIGFNKDKMDQALGK
ncbi:MAG: glutaredoxin family protein [Desulfovibrionaceae bacterium]